MKTSYVLALGIAAGTYSPFNFAGSISDTYATGDTLNATTLNNIKSAVNDNNQQIVVNSSSIVMNQLGIDYMFGGDGSAGDLTVSSNLDWSVTPPTNPNFGNITIDAGQTLTVPAGTTIRCSGTFTNNGTLTVKPGAQMAGHDNFAFGATPDIYSVGHPGDSFRAAVGGAYYTNATGAPVVVQGGKGGRGIPRATAVTSFNSFRIGGGSGSGWHRDSNVNDGDGGGLVRIYCDGPITNNGAINAPGESGNTGNFGVGGGGGGILILASLQRVDNTSGTIDASGGNGGPSDIYGGAGGGGGGGIVIFAAAVIQSVGAIDVSGGSPGATAIQVNNLYRVGGGAGGASGGDGGDGSDIPAAATATAGFAGFGSQGYVIEFPVATRPGSLLH